MSSGVTASGTENDEPSSAAASALDLDTLSCDAFYDPGSSTIPFPYPPPAEELMSCR